MARAQVTEHTVEIFMALKLTMFLIICTMKKCISQGYETQTLMSEGIGVGIWLCERH